MSSMEMGGEKLVGERAHERTDREIEPMTVDNQALWMALLSDEDTLVLKPEIAEGAKNRLVEIQNSRPDLIESCKGKSLEECRKILESFEVAKAA